MKQILKFAPLALAVLAVACGPQIKKQEEEIIETKTYDIALSEPADAASWTLSETEDYNFSWEAAPGQTNYKLQLSLLRDISNPKSISVRGTSQKLSGKVLDGYLKELGIGPEETETIYWSVAPYASVKNTEYKTQVRKLTVKRMMDISEDWGPVTEPYVVKVAVVYEDPIYQGKRIHEREGWNDPHKQMLEYKADFEKYAHGAIRIEIVEEHESDKMFCYTASTADGVREYMTPELLYERYLNPDPENGKAHIDIDGKDLAYDYVAMMDEFGLSAKVDAGTVNEVWVYNHPACHMNESRFMGEKGFWCNSGPILYGTGPDAAHNRKLVCVMFCNYERTVDLALHSFGHRVESIISHLYYPNDIFHWFPDDALFSGQKKDLRAHDKFFSHGKAYDKVGDHGYAHIGTCHSPFNTDENYGYSDPSYMYTYADEWEHYPVIKEDKANAKKLNCYHWKGSQYGYMEFFLSHIPHFKGINTYDPNDLHLNNWWYYLYDFYGAKEYEARLQREIL